MGRLLERRKEVVAKIRRAVKVTVPAIAVSLAAFRLLRTSILRAGSAWACAFSTLRGRHGVYGRSIQLIDTALKEA